MDELCRRPLRCILHLDLDCFYAQVESKRLGLPEEAPLAVQQWGGLLAVKLSPSRLLDKENSERAREKEKADAKKRN